MVPGKQKYCCRIVNSNVTERIELNSVLGRQKSGKTNEDVEILEIDFPNKIHYLPSGLAKIFPKLKCLEVRCCGLKELNAEDLRGLSNIEKLRIVNNPVTTLPDDLLIHTKKMRILLFESNQLKVMSSELINEIPDKQWETISFKRNAKINAIYYSNSIDYLKHLQILKLKMDLLRPAQEVHKDNLSGAPSNTAGSSSKNCDKKRTKSKPNKKAASGSNFNDLLALKDLCDFTVLVGFRKIPVHKVVLACRSSVFADMIKQNKNVNKFEVGNDFSEKSVDAFLRSMYTLEVESDDNALELFELAAKFDVPELKSMYEQIVIKNMNSDTAIKALKLGNCHKSDVMVDAAFDNIKTEYPKSITSRGLKRKPEAIEDILNLKETIKKAKMSIKMINTSNRDSDDEQQSG